MAQNFPGPYEVRINYSTLALSVLAQHQIRLSCFADGTPDVGTPFSSINLLLKNGPPHITAQDAVDNFVLDMKALYYNTAAHVIGPAELWKYASGTFDASFVSTYAIAVQGTSANTTVPGQQSIVTFRTENGGIFKLTFMETYIGAGGPDTGTFANAALESIAADIEAQLYPWIGRDNGYPVARIAHFPGENERLWRKRYRP